MRIQLGDVTINMETVISVEKFEEPVRGLPYIELVMINGQIRTFEAKDLDSLKRLYLEVSRARWQDDKFVDYTNLLSEGE
jgi:hypothetical protein